MYAMLAALVILGYIIEGVRIMGTGMPVGEATWSPVGWLLGSLFLNIPLSDQAWGLSYRVMWMVHMLNTMFFIASIGYSKFSHIYFCLFSHV